jgi:hypothetical protein
MERYEVTVPILVSVNRDLEEVEVVAVEIGTDWGGFFSEAEDAGGVWQLDCGTDGWGFDQEVFDAARAAVALKFTGGR